MNEESEYKEVRSIIRAIDILRALNDFPECAANTSHISNKCGINRTTTKRILETLRSQGLVRLGSKDGYYILSDGIFGLTKSIDGIRWISEKALPIMNGYSQMLKWSSDIATMDGLNMVVRESTQNHCKYVAHRPLLGERLPLFSTTLGMAYLSFCSDYFIEEKIEDHIIQKNIVSESSKKKIRNSIWANVENTRSRGFSAKEDFLNGNVVNRHIGAIALPIIKNNIPQASINIIYEKTSTTKNNVLDFYYPKLLELKVAIESII